MASSVKLLLLLSGLLAGCASHQLAEKTLTPTPALPYQTIQVQVKFATPAQSAYLATQLVNALAEHGVAATVVASSAAATGRPGGNTALLQLTLMDSWTETFISHRYKHRRSLTQMRGRIPRESPRFRSEALLRDLPTGRTVWQSETVTAGPWYSDFTANTRSLAVQLARQLRQQGLIAPAPVPDPDPS